MRGKQPTGETLPEFMMRIARRRLRHLHVKYVRVAQQQVAQVRCLRDDVLERGNTDTKCAAAGLAHGLAV